MRILFSTHLFCSVTHLFRTHLFSTHLRSTSLYLCTLSSLYSDQLLPFVRSLLALFCAYTVHKNMHTMGTLHKSSFSSFVSRVVLLCRIIRVLLRNTKRHTTRVPAANSKRYGAHCRCLLNYHIFIENPETFCKDSLRTFRPLKQAEIKFSTCLGCYHPGASLTCMSVQVQFRGPR